MIGLKDVWVRYPDGVYGLRGVDLKFEGGFLAVLGPNGSGKTTMLKVMACILKPTRGSVFIRGVDPWALPEDKLLGLRRRHIYVQEKPKMLKGDVLYNVAYPLRLRGVSRDESRRRALEALEELRISRLAEFDAKRLSAGQARLVSIARAIAVNPEVILFDEPTAYLDRDNRRLVLELLKRLKDRGVGLVVASHVGEVAEIADEAITLEQGKITGRSRRKGGSEN